jgi:hypothetical protein
MKARWAALACFEDEKQEKHKKICPEVACESDHLENREVD